MRFIMKAQAGLIMTVSAMAILFFVSPCLGQPRQMSPEEYRDMVNRLDKQNKDALTQQVNQQINSQKNTQKPVPAVTTEKPDTDINNTPVEQTTPAALQTQPEVTTLPVTTPPPQSGKVQTQQPFTGFGNPADKNTNQNNNSSGDKSSGWKIQY